MYEHLVRAVGLIFTMIFYVAAETSTTMTVTTVEPSGSSSNTSKIPIYIGGFFSHGGVWDSSGILPAVAMALDHINEKEDVLPGYDLRMVWNDTQCDAALGSRVLFDQLFNKPQKLLLIGDGCSTSSQAIAGPAYHWNLNMVSYAATSPALSNRAVYPYFFRTIPPDTMYNPARIRLMREFGWRKVGIIHGKHEISSLAADDLHDLLQEANITVLTSETFASEDPTHQIQNLKAVDAKIIANNMYATKARRTFCEAYRNGMVGPGYVWMLVGWYSRKWWEEEDDTVPCSKEELAKAVKSSNYIATEALQLSTLPDVTVANITAAEFVNLMEAYLQQPRWADYQWHNDNPFGYDAAWAIGLMLDKAVHRLREMGRRLEDFTYDDKDMAEVFFELLKETKFTGVSGPVSFRDGDRIGLINIRQLQAGCDNSSWVLHKEDCFLFVHQALSYPDAQHHCQAVDSQVAVITNKTEHMFVINHLQNNTNLEDGNRWYLGHSTNDPWVPDGGDQSSTDGICIHSISMGDGWKTTSCGDQMSFICRKEADYLERPVALFLDDGGEGELEMTGSFVWPGGEVPIDHTPEEIITVLRVHDGISSEQFASICVLIAMAIILALTFLVFNLLFREQKQVKLSSPYLNNLIILGSFLIYIGIFLGGLDSNFVSEESHALSCQLRIWFLSIGFVVAFGSMFSKTWRVHKIAAFKTPKRKIITDNQLFVMVLIFVLVDIILLLLWHAIDAMTVRTKDLPEKDDPAVAYQRLAPYYEYCTCRHYIYWMIPLFGYKVLLLVFGAFLAWETRKVRISALNDSKLIGMSVYNVIVLCTIGVSVSFVISSDPATLYVFTSCVVLFCTTITQVIVFVPKMISVYKYPNGPPTLSTLNKSQKKSSVAVPSISAINVTGTNNQMHVSVENETSKESRESASSDKNERTTVSRLVSGGGCGIWCGPVTWGCCYNNFNDDVVEESKTCSENGSKSCSRNNDEKGENFHDDVVEESKTCSENGSKSCSRNNDEKGENFHDDVVEESKTCSENGSKSCSRNNDEKEENFHDDVVEESKTCSENGSKSCPRNNDEKGENFHDDVVEESKTCSENGSKSCSRNDEKGEIQGDEKETQVDENRNTKSEGCETPGENKASHVTRL